LIGLLEVGALVGPLEGEFVCLFRDVLMSSARQPAIAKEYLCSETKFVALTATLNLSPLEVLMRIRSTVFLVSRLLNPVG